MVLNQTQRIGKSEDSLLSEIRVVLIAGSLLRSLEPQSPLDVEISFTKKAERWHMPGLWYETFKDEERIGIEDKMLRLRRTSGAYKDLEMPFYEA